MVTAQTGTLSSVTMVNDSGKTVAGIMTPDNKAWKPTGTAGLRPHLHHDDRRPRPRRHADPADVQLHHVTPSNQTQVYFNTTGGNLLGTAAPTGWAW